MGFLKKKELFKKFNFGCHYFVYLTLTIKRGEMGFYIFNKTFHCYWTFNLIITHFASVLNRPLLQETVLQKVPRPKSDSCLPGLLLLSLCLLGPYVILSYLSSWSAGFFFCPQMTFVLEDGRKWQLLQHFKRAHHYHTREPFFWFGLVFLFPICLSHCNA